MQGCYFRSSNEAVDQDRVICLDEKPGHVVTLAARRPSTVRNTLYEIELLPDDLIAAGRMLIDLGQRLKKETK